MYVKHSKQLWHAACFFLQFPSVCFRPTKKHGNSKCHSKVDTSADRSSLMATWS